MEQGRVVAQESRRTVRRRAVDDDVQQTHERLALNRRDSELQVRQGIAADGDHRDLHRRFANRCVASLQAHAKAPCCSKSWNTSESRQPTTRAGLPATMAHEGTSPRTTLPRATIAPAPMRLPGEMLTLAA